VIGFKSMASEMHDVDIVMPVHNPGEWFLVSVDSIIQQAFPRWRLIVVDDGSNEKGKELIRQVASKDDRIMLIEHDRNKGGGVARNTALSYCEAEFIAFCDSDDIWPEDKLEKQIEFMRRRELPMTHGDLKKVYDVPYSLDLLEEKRLETRKSQERVNIISFLHNPNLFCSSVMLKRSAVGGARFGTMKARHPFRFWSCVLQSGIESEKCPELFYYYYVREGSVSFNKVKMVFYTAAAYFLYSPNYRIAFGGFFSRAGVFIKESALSSGGRKK